MTNALACTIVSEKTLYDSLLSLRRVSSDRASIYRIDTRANPLWSIWTHPLDAPEFLAQHPEYRATDQKTLKRDEAGTHPSSDSNNAHPPHSEDRGFFGSLKDAVIGTKEEREAKQAWV